MRIASLVRMAIPKPAPGKVTPEPSHHEFEIEQPYEELYEGLQMTGNQGLKFKNQQQHQMETLPRSGVSGLPEKDRQMLANAFNQELERDESGPGTLPFPPGVGAA